ncbi:pentapeptide repeat-containing protein, partial [Staphylococcus xylosus]
EFHNTLLKNVEFLKSNLNNMSIYQTSLKSCDISKSFFGNITVGKDDLMGCKVSSEQAVQIAKLIGIVVVD